MGSPSRILKLEEEQRRRPTAVEEENNRPPIPLCCKHLNHVKARARRRQEAALVDGKAETRVRSNVPDLGREAALSRYHEESSSVDSFPKLLASRREVREARLHLADELVSEGSRQELLHVPSVL